MKDLLKNQKIRKVAFIVIILSIIIVTAGCNLVQMKPSARKSQVLAKIEKEKITRQDFNYYFSIEKLITKVQGQEYPTDEEQLSQIKTQLLDSIVNNEMLAYLAKKEEVSVEEETIDSQVEKDRDELAKQLGGEEEYKEFLEENDITIEEFDVFLKDYYLKMQYIEGLITKITEDISVSEKESKEYYEENIKSFDPSTAKAKHILVNKENKDLAEEIAKRAKAGEDFDKLIEEYNGKENILEATDLGEFTKAQMVPEFSDAAFALKAGESSDLVETEYGFHVLKLDEKDEKPVQEFNEVKEQINLTLKQKAQQEAFMKYIEEKEKELTIKKYPEKL